MSKPIVLNSNPNGEITSLLFACWGKIMFDFLHQADLKKKVGIQIKSEVSHSRSQQSN